MNKAFVASLFFGLASISQAAFIQCSPGQGDVIVNAVSSSAVFTCALGAGAGAGSTDDNLAGDFFNVTSIRLRLSGTFQDNNAVSGNTYSVAYNGVSTGPIGSIACTATALGDGNNQALGSCITTTGFLAVVAADTIPQFTVTVSGAAGSNPLPFNASGSVFYEVTAVDTRGTPEPATMGLMGLSLLGLAAFGRRKV